MGWTYQRTPRDKKELIAELAQGSLRHVCRANNLWTLQETVRDGKRVVYVLLYRLSKDRDTKCWGWKDIHSDDHPNHFDCPLSYLNEMTPPRTQEGRDWVKMVREKYYEKRVLPMPGLKFKLANDDREVMILRRLTRMTWAARYPCGKVFRVLRRDLGKHVNAA